MFAIVKSCEIESTVKLKKIAVAILCYNERDTIGLLLRSLARQSIFSRKDFETHVYVVANGCTDDTLHQATKALEEADVKSTMPFASVHNLHEKGKANAWNQFVHNIAPEETELALFLDADIGFHASNTCEIALNKLIDSPQCCLAIDTPVKDAALKTQKSVYERVLLGFTNTEYDPSHSLTGQFYCARFRDIKRIVMPTGIINEDGYLRAMLLTQNFKAPEDVSRLVWAKDAIHTFETERNPFQLFHHQVRLTLGNIVNIVLFAHLRRVVANGQGVPDYVKRQNDNDPHWIFKDVTAVWSSADYADERRKMLRRRRLSFANRPFANKIVTFPIFAVAMSLDIATYWMAQRILRQNRAEGFW